MKNLFKLPLAAILVLGMASCNNPKLDAQEVCDCYQNVIKKAEQAEDSDIHKCIALAAEKLLKYKEKPKELIEFNIQLESCTKDFSKTGESK